MSNQSRYILSKRIARGGMAEIFLGKAIGSDDFERVCAIKRILPHHAQEKEFVEMFRTEAGICKRLQHANIVQVYDFKKVDGNYAIIMEFVNGTDLRSLLAACEKARVKLSVAMVVYIGAHVARGLQYAHTKVDDITRKPLGIVHRDISPQNVLISYDGEVKVIDFGIANYEAKSMETKPGVVKGKYSYMSPEQVSAKALDARSDVFSLAVVLWEALAMKRLFAAETEVETIRNVQNCLIKSPLREINQNVDDELMHILNKALEKDRKTRYQSSAAFEKDLLKYLNSRFPEFNSSDLGNFLKQLLSAKRNETQEDIKKLLSMPSNTGETFEEGDPGSLSGSSSKSEITSPPYAVTQSTNASLLSRAVSSKGLELELQGNITTGSQLLLPRSSPMTMAPTRPTPTKNSVQLAPRSASPHPQPTNFTWTPSGMTNRSARPPRTMLMLGLSASLLLGTLGLLFVKTGVRAKKDNMEFYVQTVPANITVNLDSKPLFDGDYVRTPLKMTLPVGQHKLVLGRTGYVSRIIRFDGGPGDIFREDTLVLEPDPKVQLAPVRIKITRNEPVYIDINRGFFKGNAPVAIVDLQYGASHELIAYPNYPQKRGAFKCSFVPRSKAFTNPYVITLEVGTETSPSRCIAIATPK